MEENLADTGQAPSSALLRLYQAWAGGEPTAGAIARICCWQWSAPYTRPWRRSFACQ